ncbi:hypothetical protein L0B53_14670 [Vibrio sp. SS-MA-C1-2]|uniref:hypothetical protein n=1 Tax=Vibrio sp. SS-MA-C1-2 TaxID=2908646 RepID=UPI001F43AF5B|nr:hypothetical protein [Vibrio sp. SS-MA-C1-2]UJF18252.1 hypothetical protein L0B53_14670 [Vibrio sp. SS-MA-C1-2]
MAKTVTMEFPAHFEEQMQAKLNSLVAEERSIVQGAAKLRELLSMDSLSLEMEVYALKQQELLDLAAITIKISGTGNKLLRDIINKFSGRAKPLSENQRVAVKENLFRLLKEPSTYSALNDLKLPS